MNDTCTSIDERVYDTERRRIETVFINLQSKLNYPFMCFFFSPKLSYLNRHKYPKKTFFEFFLRFLWDFVPVLKVKKW